MCYVINQLFQYMTEKIGGAKGTELDEDYVEMERVSCCHCWKCALGLSAMPLRAYWSHFYKPHS